MEKFYKKEVSGDGETSFGLPNSTTESIRHRILATMTTGPGCFADIGRKARNQLSKGYLPDEELSEWSGGMIDFVCGLFTPNGWLSKKSKQIELACAYDISPSAKTIASVQIPNVRSSKVEFQLGQPNITYTVASNFHKSPTFDASAVIGSPTFALGVAAGYETSYCKFTKCAAGISVSGPTSCASLILGDNGDIVEVSYIQRINEIKKIVVAGKIKRTLSTNTNNFILGGTYTVDELTAVKAKVNTNGKLGAVLKLKLHPRLVVKLSTELDTKALKKSPKFDVFFSQKFEEN